MADFKLSNEAKGDLIRIYHYGVDNFGMTQADKYFDSFFRYFDIISQQPYAFESIDHIKKGYRRCACGADSIYYKIENNKVEIIAIIGSQDLNNILQSDNQVLNDSVFSDYEEIQGIQTAMKITMKNMETGSVTLFEIRNAEYNTEIPPETFTKRNMEK